MVLFILREPLFSTLSDRLFSGRPRGCFCVCEIDIPSVCYAQACLVKNCAGWFKAHVVARS